MRYISEDQVLRSLPANWLDLANTKSNELREMSREQRKKALATGSEVWSKLKDELATCSGGKCWYCETQDTRSDNAIDHFRPKGKVAECDGHEGYWWLAFDWRNFRYSCTFCNSRRKDRSTGDSGGKQDHFPLLDESGRVVGPDQDLKNEKPCLLDPLSPTDPRLLWFDEDGSAVPRYSPGTADRLRKRAEVSIELYHLNHTRIREKRKLLANDIARNVRKADRYFNDYESGDPSAEDMIEAVFEQLVKAVSEKSEYSAAARSYLYGLRTPERPWIDELI